MVVQFLHLYIYQYDCMSTFFFLTFQNGSQVVIRIMPEIIEKFEQIVGRGNAGPALGYAVGLALFSIKPSHESLKYMMRGIYAGVAVSFPINWIQLRICDRFHLPEPTSQNKETLIACGAQKIDALFPGWRDAISVDTSGTLLGYVAGLTPRANIVIPNWKAATIAGGFLGGSVGRVIGERPSTQKNAQDFLVRFLNKFRKRPLDHFLQAFTKFYGPACGAVMGGVFLGSYCGVHNCLAKKRGVGDVCNHMAANCVASASLGCLHHGSTGKCIVTMMTAFLVGRAIASMHLKKVDLE